MQRQSKEEIRKHCRSLRKAQSATDRAQKSVLLGEMFQDFCGSLIEKGAVALFRSTLEEPDLKPIEQYLFSRKVKMLYPRVVSKTELNFHEVKDPSREKWQKSSFGIEEPSLDSPAFSNFSDVDFFLIPGVAFGFFGERLGMGVGYYDRFLTQIPSIKIGVAFDFQVFPKLPQDSHDLAVDSVLTELRWTSCRLSS